MVPVDPKPPAPLSVSSKDWTSTTSGVEIRSKISCATLSPLSTDENEKRVVSCEICVSNEKRKEKKKESSLWKGLSE